VSPAHARWRRPAWRPWQPVVVVVAAVVVAAAVALVLAQSAGAIHLPLLGGTGAGPGGPVSGAGGG
jgi:hypothetical protein